MKTEAFFDEQTSTLTYVVWDPETRDAVVLDPVLDFDPIAVRVRTESADRVVAFVERERLTPRYLLETHAHADHLSGAQYLKERFGAPVAIGSAITKVQAVFKEIFNLEEGFTPDGRQFDTLLNDGEILHAGSIAIAAIHTPGHTPACMTYEIGGAIYTGDTMFMPDFGTGRCDFPAGSSEDLYDSITQKLYTLPDDTKVYVGHDYQPGGRKLAYRTTIGASKRDNIQLNAGTSKAELVQFRTTRDKTLSPPRLLFASVQVNIRAGHLPSEEDNGRRYLKMPIGLFG